MDETTMTTATLEATQKVRLTRAYRGRTTEEDFYIAGAVLELPAEDAQRLIAEGAAIAAPGDAAVSEPAEDGPSSRWAARHAEARKQQIAARMAQRAEAARLQAEQEAEAEAGHRQFITAIEQRRAEDKRIADLKDARAERFDAFMQAAPDFMALFVDLAARVAALEGKAAE
jgi:hypothetical protein